MFIYKFPPNSALIFIVAVRKIQPAERRLELYYTPPTT